MPAYIPVLIGGLAVAGGVAVYSAVKKRRPVIQRAGITATGLEIEPQISISTEILPAITGKEIPKPITVHTFDPKPAPKGIKVWGTSEHDTKATYRPVYIKWDQCRDFFWGLCAKDFLDNLGEQNTPHFQNVRDNFISIMKFVFPGAAFGDWLTKQFCLVFKFPLYKWADQYGGTGWEVGRYNEAALNAAAPPSPLTRQEGWHRCWIRNPPFDSSTRNETTVALFFPTGMNYPENNSAVTVELLGTWQIRAMLRIDTGSTGAMDVHRLAGAVCKDANATFWFTTRGTAMKVFK